MSLQVKLGDLNIYNNQILNIESARQNINVIINSYNNELSTLIIYDLSAPSSNNPVNSPLIHFLEINIPGSKIDQGNVLAPYMPPNPPLNSGAHTYIIDLFKQNDRINPDNIAKRESFPLTQFVQFYGLVLINRIMFQVNPMVKAAPIYDDPPEQDDKYCDCIVKVAAKQPPSCNSDRAWFQERDGHKCYNPYAVCHKTVQGVGRPSCKQHYNYESMSDDQLIGFASLERINIPQPYDRNTLIQAINSYKK
jgi:hypothetical protein